MLNFSYSPAQSSRVLKWVAYTNAIPFGVVLLLRQCLPSIGQLAFWYSVTFVLFFFAFVMMSVSSVLERQKNSLFFLAFSLLLFTLMAVRFSYELDNHLFLNSLSVERVADVRAGNTSVPRDRLDLVVNALRGNEWHPGYGKGELGVSKIPLVITLKNGDTRRFQVINDARQGGLVLQFVRGSEESYSVDGYAFCPQLSEALKELSVKLP